VNVVLVRVGIDSGSGGIQGPLLAGGGFEFIPIPDGHKLAAESYGNTMGRHGRRLVEYFPPRMQARVMDVPMHSDPEWQSFTYGDPTPPKAVLRRLQPGDLLVFYCGLQGWDFPSAPALYLAGFFEVEWAGLAPEFSPREVQTLFAQNFHVRHRALFRQQRDKLVLVKGSADSRLFERAYRISAPGRDLRGTPLKVLSTEAQNVFGDFGGKISIQRSTPRWVAPEWAERAAAYLRSLE